MPFFLYHTQPFSAFVTLQICHNVINIYPTANHACYSTPAIAESRGKAYKIWGEKKKTCASVAQRNNNDKHVNYAKASVQIRERTDNNLLVAYKSRVDGRLCTQQKERKRENMKDWKG